jgi:hypothetical protein
VVRAVRQAKLNRPSLPDQSVTWKLAQAHFHWCDECAACAPDRACMRRDAFSRAVVDVVARGRCAAVLTRCTATSVSRGRSSEEGSEHYIEGEQYPLELHFVHVNTAYSNGDINAALASGKPDALLVVGQMFKVGASQSPSMDAIAAGIVSGDVATARSIVATDLMDTSDGYYTYAGSLTTPTCNPVVTWVVLASAIDVTEVRVRACGDGYLPALDLTPRVCGSWGCGGALWPPGDARGFQEDQQGRAGGVGQGQLPQPADAGEPANLQVLCSAPLYCALAASVPRRCCCRGGVRSDGWCTRGDRRSSAGVISRKCSSAGPREPPFDCAPSSSADSTSSNDDGDTVWSRPNLLDRRPRRTRFVSTISWLLSGWLI